MKNKVYFLLLSICCTFFLTGRTFFLSLPSATATEFYMAPSGSDITGNGSIGNPWGTLEAAQNGISAGDTLYARGGTYTDITPQNFRWTTSGSEGAPITIQAYPGETPIFDGTATTSRQFLHIEEADWLTIDGLTVRGYHNVIWMGREDINSPGRATHNVIRNNYFYDSAEHLIYASWGNEDLAIYNNTFEHPGGHPLGPFTEHNSFWSLHFWHGPGVQRAEVYNNLFLDANSSTGQGGGVVFGDGARDVNVYNNTFYGNANGVSVRSGQGEGPDRGVINLTVRNNIFHIPNGNQEGIFVNHTPSLSQISADNNVYYKPDNGKFIYWDGANYDLQGFQANTTNGDNSTEADPLLVSPGLTAAGDFHLQSGSPAIDTGVATGAPATDIDGNSRPQGAGFDIGAYELLVAPVENADFDGSGFVDGSDFLA